jgi:hypothetical protein
MVNLRGDPLARALTQGDNLDGDALVVDGLVLDLDMDDKLDFFLVFTCPACGQIAKPVCTNMAEGDSFACEHCAAVGLTLNGEGYTRVKSAVDELRRAARLV